MLQEITQKLLVNKECQRMAIVGLGGIGKTDSKRCANILLRSLSSSERVDDRSLIFSYVKVAESQKAVKGNMSLRATCSRCTPSTANFTNPHH